MNWCNCDECKRPVDPIDEHFWGHIMLCPECDKRMTDQYNAYCEEHGFYEQEGSKSGGSPEVRTNSVSGERVQQGS